MIYVRVVKKIILAISGGVDSMVLLDMVSKGLIKSIKPSQTVVAHFDHGIRDDSKETARIVQTRAQELGLEFVLGQGDLGPKSSEERARKSRHDFLKKVQADYGAKSIVTAHHQDDVVETMILNILRGTGWRGLVSLRQDEVYVRPLLSATKSELMDYAIKNRLVWHEDSTNADTNLKRNYVRLRLIPSLLAADGSAYQKLVNINKRLSKIRDEADQLVGDIAASLTKESCPALTVNRAAFNQLELITAAEVLRYMLLQVGACNIDRRLIERLLVFVRVAKKGKTSVVCKHVRLFVDGENLVFTNNHE